MYICTYCTTVQSHGLLSEEEQSKFEMEQISEQFTWHWSQQEVCYWLLCHVNCSLICPISSSITWQRASTMIVQLYSHMGCCLMKNRGNTYTIPMSLNKKTAASGSKRQPPALHIRPLIRGPVCQSLLPCLLSLHIIAHHCTSLHITWSSSRHGHFNIHSKDGRCPLNTSGMAYSITYAPHSGTVLHDKVLTNIHLSDSRVIITQMKCFAIYYRILWSYECIHCMISNIISVYVRTVSIE